MSICFHRHRPSFLQCAHSSSSNNLHVSSTGLNCFSATFQVQLGITSLREKTTKLYHSQWAPDSIRVYTPLRCRLRNANMVFPFSLGNLSNRYRTHSKPTLRQTKPQPHSLKYVFIFTVRVCLFTVPVLPDPPSVIMLRLSGLPC